MIRVSADKVHAWESRSSSLYKPLLLVETWRDKSVKNKKIIYTEFGL